MRDESAMRGLPWRSWSPQPTRLAVALALLLALACKGKGTQAQARGEVESWQPVNEATIVGVPISAVKAAIGERLAADAPEKIGVDGWRHVRGLYGVFGGVPLWIVADGLDTTRVRALAVALAAADSDGLNANDYPIDDVTRAVSAIRRGSRPTADELADADVLLTTSYVALGEDLLTGQVQPRSVSQSWYINPRDENVDSALVRSVRNPRLDVAIARMRPQDAGYEELRGALASYRRLVTAGGWATVPAGRTLKHGDAESTVRLIALTRRLRAEGLLADPSPPSTSASSGKRRSPPAPPPPPTRYDARLAAAVARFQARHGIEVDSMLGPETVDAMNAPARFRLDQIAANLERYRWLPRTLGARYILVNVPAFDLQAFEEGEPVLRMKVIVGAEYQDRATPVFSDSMQYVVFRPSWMVPEKIAAKEILPKAAQDGDFLERNNYQMVWLEGKRRVKQRPGPKNSLGLLKFMFPNDFNIYLHDTPMGQLFEKDVRAFSHGCIRLERPAELAQFVLGWPLDRILTQMQDGKDEHRVDLPHPIPVYIVYFTAYLRDGQLYFGNDLYNRDDALVRAVHDAALPGDETTHALEELKTLEL